jgi:hypothetical protein
LCENTCKAIELSVGVLWTSPNPFSYEEKGRICAIFKVPLFLREGFSQRDAFGKGEFFFVYVIFTQPL